ncbi:penicillin-binding protein [Amnibacterium kyonggiense]|uniref:Membrane peptidoglycan carboxypeptidase n=1 Tax=Amnibacterium kyonggiense TaxID=595671 RepID=A0A4R7FLR4_9MICO|nr:penicillin-binding protein [Amnibacterium kyonggiense]TDS77318.1 membrane peptidoglycan carboxypeptidase [Amnibacterium kyonggiense]
MPSRPRTGSAVSAFFGMLAIAVVAGVMVAVAVTPAIALTGTTAKSGISAFEELPSDLKISALDQKTEIYAKDGDKDVLIASFFAQNRQVVKWDEISQVAKNAAVAGEDVRYYDHGGIDPLGIVRAAVGNLAGSDLQGASTITQQYVKNVCVQEAENQPTQKQVTAAYDVCTDASVGRKLKEARYAIALEKKYSKDQILLGYLNIAGFGGRVYGIESAAEYYFDSTAEKLTVAQAASLIAIVNNPQYLRLDVKDNWARNKERRDYILGVELKNRMITKAQYDEAVATPIATKITTTQTGCEAAGVAGFFCDYVYRTVLNDSAFGKTKNEREANLQRSGWKIYTTLDLKAERAAKKAMTAYVPKKTTSYNIGGAAVTVEVGTGRILTMVTNKDFSYTKGGTSSAVNYTANYALGQSGGWQPGSTFKVFTLLDWLKTGHTLNTVVDSNPGTVSDFTACGKPYAGIPYTYGNDTSDEGGYQSVLTGTAKSINGTFVHMAQQLDLCDIKGIADDFGVTPIVGNSDPTQYASFVIGGAYTVSPVSIAAAYAGIANEGKYCSPIAIEKVVKTDGSELAVPGSTCKQVVDPAVANAAVYALRGVFQGGTAGGDNTPDGLYEFGKTGTTDSAYDTWMTGTTSKAATSVWIGNNGSVNGARQNLRKVVFPGTTPCYSSGQGLASDARHCVWKDIQTAVNKDYGGATSWTAPEPQYLSGGAVQQQPDQATQTGTVPDVAGQSPEAAEAALVAAGYKWTLNGTTASSQPAGTVAGTDPAAGSQLPAGSSVAIQTSDGTG